jgi:hypothetical protein
MEMSAGCPFSHEHLSMALDIQAVFFPHLSGGRIEPQEN